ncbi:DUF6906 family protein [Desulfosporosinus nitroreducens]|nr:hypothetical protein [Desulfosporosinus nitroreducens]MCO1599860.1 hypothetical protein [Desulfosporosinus nitroreducens]
MKNPKRPTRKQKEKMKCLPAPKNWLVVSDNQGRLKVIHRITSEIRELGA